jgi:hypothetical protein
MELERQKSGIPLLQPVVEDLIVLAEKLQLEGLHVN